MLIGFFFYGYEEEKLFEVEITFNVLIFNQLIM